MNLKNKLKELKPHNLNCNIFDVYSYNGLTMQELLCQFFTKINECVGVSNSTLELSEWLVNEGLEKEVVKKLLLWLEDGTLEYLINTTLFENLNSQLEIIKNQEVNVKFFGAKGDGVTDDTNAIRNAIKYCKDNKINNLLIPPGVYMVDCSEQWENHTPSWLRDKYHAFMLHDNLNVNMYGATLKCISTSNENYIMFRIENCSNATINGGTLIGDRNRHIGTDGEWGYGIAIRDAQNIIINDVISRDFWGDGLYIGDIFTPGEVIENIEIRNCKFDNNRRQGISISGGNNIKILNCSLTNTNGTAPQSGIDIEPDKDFPAATNILIDGCYFSGNKGNAIESWHPKTDGSEELIACDNVVVSNCTFDIKQKLNFRSGRNFKISNCINPFLDCKLINGISIIGNHIEYSSFCYLADSNRVIIQSNTQIQSEKTWGVGAYISGVCNNINIIGNSFENISNPVQLLGAHSNISITNNSFINTTTSISFENKDLNNIHIKGNYFKDNSSSVLVLNGSNITIDGNEFVDFESRCIHVGNYVTNGSVITNNIFNDNKSPLDNAIINIQGSDAKVINNTINSRDTKVILNTNMADEGALIIRNICTFKDARSWFTDHKEDVFIENYMPKTTI